MILAGQPPRIKRDLGDDGGAVRLNGVESVLGVLVQDIEKALEHFGVGRREQRLDFHGEVYRGTVRSDFAFLLQPLEAFVVIDLVAVKEFARRAVDDGGVDAIDLEAPEAALDGAADLRRAEVDRTVIEPTKLRVHHNGVAVERLEHLPQPLLARAVAVVRGSIVKVDAAVERRPDHAVSVRGGNRLPPGFDAKLPSAEAEL